MRSTFLFARLRSAGGINYRRGSVTHIRAGFHFAHSSQTYIMRILRQRLKKFESESGTGRMEKNMKEILLACDVDNTLIHSWKHRKEGDLCIEYIGEREQGYMSLMAAQRYSSLPNNILLVPVTTRSVEQYRRILWPGRLEPDLAVTTNGAILLGPRDDPGADISDICHAWVSQSRSMYVPYRQAMDELREILLASGRCLRVRMVDDLYLFAYCEEGQDPMDAVPESAFGTGLKIVSSGRKIYFLPPMFNKGEAVRRLEDLLRPSMILAAGDTEIDLPMAEPADRMFIPEKLYNACGSDLPQTVREKLRICPEGADFSEFVLREAAREAGKCK